MKKYTILIAFIVLLTVKVSYSQFENSDLGARAIGMGGAFTSLSDNSLAIFFNPSGLGQVTSREISAFYAPSPYGVSDISTASLTYAEPLKFGTLGLGFKTYGSSLYRETNGIVSFGKSYLGKFFYGANINYYSLSIQGYGSASSFGVDLGAMAYITKYLRWGFFGKNLTGSKIGASGEKLAQVYKTGFNFHPATDLNLTLEAEKDVRYPLSIKGGFEYSIMDYIDLRAGVSSEPSVFTAGVGFNYNLFQLDYAIYNHTDLGITHQGTITVNFGGVSARKRSKELLNKAFDN